MSNTSSPSLDTSTGRIRPNPLQQAWLSEIGFDRRLLAHYLPTPAMRKTDSGRLQRAADVMGQSAEHVAKAMSSSAQPGAQADTRPTSSDISGSDLAMAALRQAGGQRRVSSAAPAGQSSTGEEVSSRVPVRPQSLPSDWAALQAHAEACQACNLQAQRHQLVFGAGDTEQPDWLIVGEAPGKADDRTGLPFQGKAGTLLHAMLVAAGVHPATLTLGGRPQHTPAWSSPAGMYFANLVKCRPLGNRSPDADEAAACIPYLTQQIELLQPRRILALGRLAAQALLHVQEDVEDLRGRVHTLTTAGGRQIPVVVTWHPAALLMHPQNKAQAWEDLNLVKRL